MNLARRRGARAPRHHGLGGMSIWRDPFRGAFVMMLTCVVCVYLSTDVEELTQLQSLARVVSVEQVAPAATSTVREEKPSILGGQVVKAPAGNRTYQDMDATCTLKRYTHLFGKFCDPVERSKCDLKAFRAYFGKNSAKEKLVGGCPLDEAICYAKRYPDLFQSYCDDSHTKCNYFSLRQHYEERGKSEKRVWGCDFQPIQPAATVSLQQPAVTIDKLPVSTTRDNVLGKASVQFFQGSWKPVEFNKENVPSKSICPMTTGYLPRFCNFTAREGYQPAKYEANGLPKWSAKRFVELMNQDGGRLGFVGDFLMLQLKSELDCHAEAEHQDISQVHYYETFMAPLPESIEEQFELRSHSDKGLRDAFSLKWVEDVIADKVKYLFYSTGSWWNPAHFRRRGEWCDYESWEQPSQEELVSIYAETLEQTLLPIFTSLVKNHGVIPIWVDVPPSGKIDLATGENFDMNEWAKFYRVLPRLNEVGRKMMIKAGGWVLPIWDVSFPRWQDHLFHDNPERNDQLHWCAQQYRSVPALWAQLLSQVLYGNDESDANSVVSAPAPALWGQLLSKVFYGNDESEANSAVRQAKDFDMHRQQIAFEERLLLENPPTSFVRLSRSIQSSCTCADAKKKKKCRANIRCSWDEKTEVCSERP